MRRLCRTCMCSLSLLCITCDPVQDFEVFNLTSIGKQAMMSLSKAVASGKTAASKLLSVTSVAEQHQSIGEGRVMCSCPSLLLNINLC